jgi:N4-gp56 family major capsid protein
MANVNTTTVNSQFQLFFSKSLLERQIPLLQMEQFAQKVPYPTKTGGNKTVRFFRFDNPSIASITTLSEGTSPTGGAGERQLTLSTVEATLEQFGSSIVLTDVFCWPLSCSTTWLRRLSNLVKMQLSMPTPSRTARWC